MVSLRSTALTTGLSVSQCAETTRIALGRGSRPPSPFRKLRAGGAGGGKVGAPCDRNRLGNIIALSRWLAPHAPQVNSVRMRVRKFRPAGQKCNGRAQRIGAIAKQRLHDQGDGPERGIFPAAMRVGEEEAGGAVHGEDRAEQDRGSGRRDPTGPAPERS